jgi:dGTPase
MIHTREFHEEIEAHSLAPYGFHSKDSQGRQYPEKEADYRTCFQRDRDRILHTTAFRRLEYKTQVFIIFEGDHFRTRLTHTLEVAQIGRSLARTLGANEDLVESICLAHDLGHPPFGHSGEDILNCLMKDHGGFNHNVHSLRIVTELEKRYPDFPGLNLTWETREGIVKHETEYDISYAKHYNPKLRGHLEAQISNVADELAYTAHDLDDGLRSGMLNAQMLSGVELWEITLESAAGERNVLSDLERHRLIRQMVGLLITDVIEATNSRIKNAKVKKALDLQKLDHNVVGYSDDMLRRNREIKDFLYSNLYRHHRVVRMAKKAEKILSELFVAYQNEPDMLQDHYRNLVEERGLERTICDYLAGMTDRYAIQEYEKLFDPVILP